MANDTIDRSIKDRHGDVACIMRLEKLGYSVYAREREGGYGYERVILTPEGDVLCICEDDAELERRAVEAEKLEQPID